MGDEITELSQKENIRRIGIKNGKSSNSTWKKKEYTAVPALQSGSSCVVRLAMVTWRLHHRKSESIIKPIVLAAPWMVVL
jgi:hypothetical protein